MSKLARNALCPCGSGKKYKRCCEPLRNRVSLQGIPAKTATGEPHFTVEISPEVDKKVDRILARMEQGESKGLQAELLALARQHPLQHLPPFGLGVYQLLVNDDAAAALPFFQRSVEIFPYFAEGHYNLAGCASNQGDIRKAVESYRKVMVYTDDADIADRAREQLKSLESIVSRTTPFATLDAYVANQAAFDEAYQALARNDFERAAEGFREVLEQNPGHVQSFGNLGLACAGLGRKAAALEYLDKALALDPNYTPARSNRRILETMTEGQPYMMEMAETRFYREQVEAKRTQQGTPRSSPSSIWRRTKDLLGS